MNMPKEIGNCISCDAILWNDGVSTRGGNKSYGGNKELCGDCLLDEKIYELEDEVKKLREESKKLRLQLGTPALEESYDTDKDFTWAMKELLEGRTVRRHRWWEILSQWRQGKRGLLSRRRNIR